MTRIVEKVFLIQDKSKRQTLIITINAEKIKNIKSLTDI